MSGFSTYLAQGAISHFVRRTAQPVPAGTYLALFFADPTDDNITANEVSAAWYARQAITSWSAPVGSGTSTSNSNALVFNPVTGTSISITHWAIYDSLTAGNLLYSGVLPTPKTLQVDDIYTVKAGNLTLDFQ